MDTAHHISRNWERFFTFDTVAVVAHATPHFIVPDLWLPNSPDLNPVDYKVWGVMQEHDHQTLRLDAAYLKRRLIVAWSSLRQHVIDEAIDHWRGRLCENCWATLRTFALII